MREIKFRAMVDGNWWYATPECASWEQFWALCDNKTLGQYTGLKDKNGVEIYEGDIIDNHDDYFHQTKKVVNYDPYSCYFCLIDLDQWPDTLYSGEMFNRAGEGSNFSGQIEVVGNIFEGIDK